MRSNKMKITLIISGIFLFFLLILLVCGYFVYKLLNGESIKNHTPEFKNGDIELVRASDGTAYFVKTNKKYSIGDKLESYQIIAASNKDYKILNNKISRVGENFVVIDVTGSIPDCLGIYKEKKPIQNIKVISKEGFSGPGDAYMCKDFDFSKPL